VVRLELHRSGHVLHCDSPKRERSQVIDEVSRPQVRILDNQVVALLKQTADRARTTSGHEALWVQAPHRQP